MALKPKVMDNRLETEKKSAKFDLGRSCLLLDCRAFFFSL